MSIWLKLLPMELERIEKYQEPEVEIAWEDHVVGVMSDDLKKLFTLCKEMEKAAEQYILDSRFENDDRQKEFLFLKGFEISKKAEALREIFWISVLDEFSLWGKENIGVRRGFKVVWFEEDSFFDFWKAGQN